ncbi:unnamed protein product [Paramecium pentaurelia]|uniref:Transmembrane protein n=1 Tax=Paramecium pentaurelia TaxID=43138 RepID=A0A8S1UQT8_9CILI|nr:unnamed protein product [Paramecium pentaurelia]
MDPIFYTFLGIGIGFFGSQIVMNNVLNNKQNKNPQQNQPTKKFIPSTPDFKKVFQQNQIPQQIKGQIELDDQIRKIIKIQSTPVELDTDSQFSYAQDQENNKPNQQNISDHYMQPQTPNFQNTAQAKPNIKLLVTDDQIQQIVTSPLILKQNKFSTSQNNYPQTTQSFSHTESSGQNSDKDE